MTDLELTRLCAEAIGLQVKVSTSRYDGEQFVEINTGRDPGNEGAYDPLCDDEQAMALVKHFKFPIRYEYDKWEVANQWGEHQDLNRAIVEAVAKMRAADRTARTGGTSR